jgi:hypothetical protein
MAGKAGNGFSRRELSAWGNFEENPLTIPPCAVDGRVADAEAAPLSDLTLLVRVSVEILLGEATGS